MPAVGGGWDARMSREESWRRSVLSAGDAGREEDTAGGLLERWGCDR